MNKLYQISAYLMMTMAVLAAILAVVIDFTVPTTWTDSFHAFVPDLVVILVLSYMFFDVLFGSPMKFLRRAR